MLRVVAADIKFTAVFEGDHNRLVAPGCPCLSATKAAYAPTAEFTQGPVGYRFKSLDLGQRNVFAQQSKPAEVQPQVISIYFGREAAQKRLDRSPQHEQTKRRWKSYGRA